MLVPMRTMIAIASATVLAIGMTGCDSEQDAASSGASSSESASSSASASEHNSAPVTDVASTSNRPPLPIAWCDELPDLTDSLDFAGPQYSEFINGYVSGQALAYALQFPFYVGVWPRTNHESWLIVGVSGGMQELQTELDVQFPGARVLAMNVTWDPYSLSVLSDSVAAAVQTVVPDATVDWSVATGLVAVELAADDVTDQLVTTLGQFSDASVCAQLTS